jgi:hypothetical protein
VDLDFLIVAIEEPQPGRRLRQLLWRPGRRNHLLVDPVLQPDFPEILNQVDQLW